MSTDEVGGPLIRATFWVPHSSAGGSPMTTANLSAPSIRGIIAMGGHSPTMPNLNVGWVHMVDLVYSLRVT